MGTVEALGGTYEWVYQRTENYYTLQNMETSEFVLDLPLDLGAEIANEFYIQGDIAEVGVGIWYDSDENAQLYSIYVENGSSHEISANAEFADINFEWFIDSLEKCHILEAKIFAAYGSETGKKIISLVFCLKEKPEEIFQSSIQIFSNENQYMEIIKDATALYIEARKCHSLACLEK